MDICIGIDIVSSTRLVSLVILALGIFEIFEELILSIMPLLAQAWLGTELTFHILSE